MVEETECSSLHYSLGRLEVQRKNLTHDYIQTKNEDGLLMVELKL